MRFAMRASIEASDARGDRNSVAHSLAMLAIASAERGRISQAFEAVEACLEACTSNLGSYCEAEAHRIKAELLWRGGDVAAAEPRIRTALGIAHDQGARLLELRAATTWTQLMREQGHSEPATQRLREVRYS